MLYKKTLKYWYYNSRRSQLFRFIGLTPVKPEQNLFSCWYIRNYLFKYFSHFIQKNIIFLIYILFWILHRKFILLYSILLLIFLCFTFLCFLPWIFSFGASLLEYINILIRAFPLLLTLGLIIYYEKKDPNWKHLCSMFMHFTHSY